MSLSFNEHNGTGFSFTCSFLYSLERGNTINQNLLLRGMKKKQLTQMCKLL